MGAKNLPDARTNKWLRVCRKCKQTLSVEAQYCRRCGHITIHDPVRPRVYVHDKMDRESAFDERCCPASHICCLYHTNAEHQTVLSWFIHNALTRHEKVVYILDRHEDTPFLNGLTVTGRDVTPAITHGQLTFYNTEQTYLLTGSFAPAQMIAWLTQETRAALTEGYAGLRVTSDMGWTQSQAIDPELLLVYEADVNDFFAQHRCRGLCRYNRWTFPSSLLIDILALHPLILSQGQTYKNPLHTTLADVLHSVDDSSR